MTETECLAAQFEEHRPTLESGRWRRGHTVSFSASVADACRTSLTEEEAMDMVQAEPKGTLDLVGS